MSKKFYTGIMKRLSLLRFCAVSLVGLIGFTTLATGQTTNVSPYCAASEADDCSNFDDAIELFEFGSFSHNSGGCNNDGDVTYFNNLNPISVKQGDSYNVKIDLDPSASRCGAAIWMDLNQDGNFSSGELLKTSSGTSTSHNWNIEIPCSAKGGVTRMRVMVSYSQTISASDYCRVPALSAWGEIEDYDVNVNTVSGDPSFAIKKPSTIYENSPTTISGKASPNKFQSATNFSWLVNDVPVSNNESFTNSFSDGDAIELRTEVPCIEKDTLYDTVSTVTPSNPTEAFFIASKNILDIGERTVLKDQSTNGPTSFEWEISPKTGGYTFIPPSSQFSKNGEVFFSTQPGIYDVCLYAGNSLNTTPDTNCKKDYLRVKDVQDICARKGRTDSIGFIEDGADPKYPANASCSFLINPCAQEINLTLDELDLKKGSGFLRIYDGKSAQGKPLWDENAYSSRGLTGDKSNPNFQETFTAKSGAVFVQFVSGSNPKGSGFSLGYNGKTNTLPELKPSIKGDTATCLGEKVTFNAESNVINPSYEWYFNDLPANNSPLTTDDSVTVSIDNSSMDTIHLVTSNCGKQDTSKRIITPQVSNQKPNVKFTADRVLLQVGESVTLEEMTDACIKNRKWTLSPNTYQFVNGTDETSKNPEIEFTDNGVYNVTLTDTTNANAVGKTTKNTYITVREYCDPNVSNLNTDIGISRVKLGKLDNRSSIGQSGYTSYLKSAATPELAKGGTYDLTIERQTNANKVHYKVWVDLNRDAKFQSNEVVANNKGLAGTVLNTHLSIPSTASTGNYRMRVAANLDRLSQNPCGPNQYGEFEDYLVKVVNDTEGPKIMLSRGDTVDLKPCGSPQKVFNQSYAMDVVDGKLNDLNVTGSVDSSSAGVYNVSYSVTDNNGNQSVKQQTFMVRADQKAPGFTLNGEDTVVLGVNTQYSDPGVNGLMDNCSGISNFTVDSSQLDKFNLGLYPVNYTAKDNAGNEATKTRHVKVVDTSGPRFSLNGQQTVTVNVNNQYNDPGVSNLTDNYYSNSELNFNVNGSVNPFEIGNYEIVYRAEDPSGNVTKLKRMVKVRDTSAPVISTEYSDTIVFDVGNVLNFRSNISATDNYTEPTIVETSGDFLLNFPSRKASQLGEYDLKVVYADSSGNRNSIQFTVSVVDRVAPELSLEGPGVINLERWNRTQYESANTIKIEDNYYPAFQVDVDTTGSYFTDYIDNNKPSGFFQIVYRAEDPSGNSTEITRDVRVRSTSGMQASGSGINIDVYPNPTQGELRIQLNNPDSENGKLSIRNSMGKQVKLIDEGKVNGSYQVDLEDASAGVYFVRYQSNDKVSVERIVVSE